MSQTILVVDDIAANRNLLGATLEPKGYEVLLASNGASAVKVAARARPNLILMDVNMPEMDGYEACRQLKAMPELAEIPVIFITANDDPESLVKGFQAGGVDYISKPFKEEEVLMRLATHLKIHTLTRALEDSNQELGTKNAALETEVTLRKQAEEKANQANEAKSQFLAFISHEMRTPLNAIIGYSEELVDSLTGEANGQNREDATRIRSASGHLLGLINNLLDLSKIEAGKMELALEEFAVPALVEEVKTMIRPLLAKNANQLLIECPNDLGSMKSDRAKVKQVLLNLLSNAGKFTQSGKISLRVQSEISNLKFEIQDSGIGMSAEQLQRLFQPYQQATSTTSRQFGGTGLGLVISRQCCRLMGGDLTVTSEPGKGSTFTVTLPC